MANSTIGSGQTFTGTVERGDVVTVLAGGVSSSATVRGGTLVINSGGTATGTLVQGVRVAPGQYVDTGYNGTFVAGSIVVDDGAMVSGTIIMQGGNEQLFGNGDTGTSVQGGGSYEVYGGISNHAQLAPGADVSIERNFLSPAELNGATVEALSGLTIYRGEAVNSLTLNAGSFVDLPELRYVAGGSAVFDSTSGVLTITEGADSQKLPLAGSYAGDSFRLASEFVGSYRSTGTVVEVVDSSGVNAAFGFNHVGPDYLLGNGRLPDSPPSSGTPVAFNSTITAGSVPSVIYDPYGVVVSAYRTIANSGAGGLLPGSYAVHLNSGGDQAIYSTIDDGRGHVITATGTGQSQIAAGSGKDTVTVRNGHDQVVTGHGANTVYLETGSNFLISQGDDRIYIGAGTDTIGVSGHTVMFNSRATLDIALERDARLELHTGIGSVDVNGNFGGGTFSGGTGGNNLLVAGTEDTTLYAGGDGDRLFASGGIGTTMNGWGGNETMSGTYGQGANIFNFNGANVTANSGQGQSTFNVGSGNNVVDSSFGISLFNFTNGDVGGATYIGGFSAAANNSGGANANHVHLAGYASDEMGHALSTATLFQGSETLHLRDGSTIIFGGVTGLTGSSFT